MRLGHYLNQFFAGIGGEKHANVRPAVRDSPVGPGRLLKTLLGDEGVVASTLICGDNFFNEHLEEAQAAVRAYSKGTAPLSCSPVLHLRPAAMAARAPRYSVWQTRWEFLPLPACIPKTREP